MSDRVRGASSAAPKQLSAQIQDQIIEWLDRSGPGSATWVSDSVRSYWPRTRVADIRNFLQLDPRIRRRTGALGEVLYECASSLPTELPPQVARKPNVAPAPFREHWQPLNQGVISCSWGELIKRIPSNVEDIATEYVTLKSPRTPTWHIALVDTAIGIRWMAWVFARGLEAAAYQSVNWHLWRPDDLHEYGNESYRLKSLDSDTLVVCTWASETSLGVMRELAADATLRVSKPSDLTLTISRVSESELVRRRREITAHEDLERQLKRAGLRVRKNPVRGYCVLCGMPLSDPVSLERGIGPDCWLRASHLDHRRLQRHQGNHRQVVAARGLTDWADSVRAMIDVAPSQ